MQSAEEREGAPEPAREWVRGTVRMVAERKMALIMTDDGSLTIVKQLDGEPLIYGDYVSGLARKPGNKCVLRIEGAREGMSAVVDVLGVAAHAGAARPWID